MHMTPTITAMTLAATRYSTAPMAANGVRIDSTRIDIAFVGPVERCREEPQSAPAIVATTAEYSP
jgi:hypothetical protein